MNILITGAASGIGRGLSEELAADGHHIVATDCNADAMPPVVQTITSRGFSGEPHVVDVCDQQSIDSCLQKVERSIDVLINCAGVQHVARLESFPQDRWDRLIDIMLNGTCRMTRAVLEKMRANGFGRIINIGSIHSLVASPFKSAYVSAKHGLLGFSKTVALETADSDITINTICPSYVRTPLVDKQIENQAKERGIMPEEVISEVMLKPMPKGVFIGIDEISGICKFLMSDYAKNITGQEIVVDGGWTIT